MVTVYSLLTWGMYNEPPADIPECGFLGELCPPSIQGKPSLADKEKYSYYYCFHAVK